MLQALLQKLGWLADVHSHPQAHWQLTFGRLLAVASTDAHVPAEQRSVGSGGGKQGAPICSACWPCCAAALAVRCHSLQVAVAAQRHPRQPVQVCHGSLVASLRHGEVQGLQLGGVAALLAALSGPPTCSGPAAWSCSGCSVGSRARLLLLQAEERHLAGGQPRRQAVLLGGVPGQRRDFCRCMQHCLWVDGIAAIPHQDAAGLRSVGQQPTRRPCCRLHASRLGRAVAAAHRHRHDATAGRVEARRCQRASLAVQQVGEGQVLHQARAGAGCAGVGAGAGAGAGSCVACLFIYQGRQRIEQRVCQLVLLQRFLTAWCRAAQEGSQGRGAQLGGDGGGIRRRRLCLRGGVAAEGRVCLGAQLPVVI